jgi:ATP-dependent DNA ligase
MFVNKKVASEIYGNFNEKSKQEIVVRMYVQSFDNETIANATGLTLNQVNEQILHVKSGELLKSFEIASKMIVTCWDLDLVANLTGLQNSVVEELKKEMIEKGDISN